MSQDFGINNPGSGFDFDDEEEDLEAMFNRANEGEETSDDDNHLAYIYDDLPAQNQSNQQEEESADNAWEVMPQEEAAQETISDSIPTYDETTKVPDNTDYHNFEEYKAPYEEETSQSYEAEQNQPVSSTLQPSYEEEKVEQEQRIPSHYNSGHSSYSAPSASKPVAVENKEPAYSQNSSKKFNIPTEKDDIESVRKTIRILDAYRKLNSKTIVAQLIYNENDVDPQDEAALVVRVLRADPMLGRMMTVLRESASEKDRVERVFYILNTDENVLRYLGNFLETVSDVNFDQSQDHIAFAKEVERTIEGLDSKIVQHVADAQSVLVAAEDEKE